MPDERQPDDHAVGDWFVYIVECADRTFYTGITNNLERRVDEHNAGKGARYTRGRGPVSLRYREFQPDRSCASIREREIKALSRQGKQELINLAALNRV
jgi:putative endonuclease